MREELFPPKNGADRRTTDARPIAENRPKKRTRRIPGRGAMDRRSFLVRVGTGAAATATIGVVGVTKTTESVLAAEIGPHDSDQRRDAAFRVRMDCALMALDRPSPPHPDNGEETDYPYLGNYAKGLPHNDLGQVDPRAYKLLLAALTSGLKSDFDAIPLGGARPLRNPQSGLDFDMEGPDSHNLAIRPAPRIDGPENSSEMGELYWMALARDVSFTEYSSNPLIGTAAADLSRFSTFRGPKQGAGVTPATIFRGNTPGDLAGPYISQFLYKPVPYGSLTVSHRQQTVAPGVDYLTEYGNWLNNIRGLDPTQSDVFDNTPRYIRNGRDLGHYVHVDALFEAYLNACLILLGAGAPLDAGNPYNHAITTDAFGTFGDPHILSLVAEVATRALKAAWFQKWYVHRRLRPEEFGGLVHNQLRGAARAPIDREILGSQAVQEVYRKYGTYLLPQAFPEGCPLHTSYTSGHATVGGACATILKAWFDESFVLPNPVVPNADGTVLIPYTGPDAGSLTVGGELNKVASNIASGRNFAGLHWRTDFTEGLKLGEAIAIGILQEQSLTYTEHGSFTITKFDGTRVTI